MPIAKLGDSRLAFLDQLRAIAILAVVFLHYRPDTFPGGAIGVGMFFCLSGFLIATILLEVPTLDAGAAKRFIIRRVMRIYPAYFIAILISVAMIYRDEPQHFSEAVAAMPGLLTFTSLPAFPSMCFGVLWSLQVEAWFYILMPLFMLALGRKAGVMAFSLILLAASIWLSMLHPNSEWPSLLRWGAVLAIGSMTAVIWKSGMLPRLPAIISAPCLLLIAALIATGDGDFLLYKDLLAALCVGLMLAAFISTPTMPIMPGSAFIGRISYSMYLWHAIILEFRLYLIPGLPHMMPGVQFAIYLLITGCVSAASYYGIEKPGIRLGKKMVRHHAALITVAR